MFKERFVKMEEAGGGEGGGGGGAEPTVAELQAKLEAVTGERDGLATERDGLAGERDSLLGKNQELLGETKKAKEARRKADEEKARKDGDFEQLHASSEQARTALEEELTELRDSIANNKRKSKAKDIAGAISEGPNAELLATFVEKRLKMTAEGIKVVDSAGNLTVATIDDLQKEIAADPRYAALVKGNQSGGGGAPGGKGDGGGAANTIDRATWDTWPQSKRAEFAKKKGKVVD